MKKIAWVLILAISQLVARAADLPDAKAATEIIEGLQGALGDLSTILSLPPDQRVGWVMTNAEDYVRGKIVDQSKDKIKEAMKAYATAAFQAQAFKTVAIPALKNSIVMNAPVDWGLIQARMASDVDTKTAAYGTAAAGVSIAWDAVAAFSEGGAQAGFNKLTADIYNAVADAYIPGWGWFKLGTAIVDGLGNYVLDYATDTATSGMLNDLFSMTDDPNGFAKMLQTTPLPSLYKKVDDGWELVEYGRLRVGSGTDTGGEAMKQRLKDTLYTLKAGVAAAYTAGLQKDANLRAQFQPYLDAAAQAEANLRAVAGTVQTNAAPLLASIRQFQGITDQFTEVQDAQEDQAYIQEATSAPGVIPPWIYTPIPRGGFMPLFEDAYDQFHAETGGHFDWNTFSAAQEVAWTAMGDAVSAVVIPPDGANKLDWLANYQADQNAIMCEVDMIAADADGRASLMAQAISQVALDLGAQIQEESAKLDEGISALINEANETLRLTNTFYGDSYAAFTNATENWLIYVGLGGNYQDTASYLEQVEDDADTLQDLNSRRRALYAAYTAYLATVDATMQCLIPQGLQYFTNGVWDSDHNELIWGASYYPAQFEGMPVTALYMSVDPAQYEFDSQQAIQALEARLSELQGPYDQYMLQMALQRIAHMLDLALQPFTAADPRVTVYSLMGRVNGILNYRQPVENTDLYMYVQRVQTVWSNCQSRIAYLQHYPKLIDATPYIQFGITNLGRLESGVAADRSLRAGAPALANLASNQWQQVIAPVLLNQNPDYYEGLLAGLAHTIALINPAYMRGLSGYDPVDTLMTDYYTSYMQQLTGMMQQAQADYSQVIGWYSKTMPSVTPSTSTLAGAVGGTVNVSFTASEAGGTYSAPFLPSGLTINPSTGTISGSPLQAGSFTIPVDYTSPEGVSTYTIVQIGVQPPGAAAATLTISGGLPVLQVQGVEGAQYLVQALDDLGSGDRWENVGTLTAGQGQNWVDNAGVQGNYRFYRVVWDTSQ